MRQRLCKVCRGWHETDAWPAECFKPAKVARSGFPTPMFNADAMPAVKSMLDGLYYDSKSALRATYKAAGVIEVGNEEQKCAPTAKPQSNKPAVVQALKKSGVWDQLSD